MNALLAPQPVGRIGAIAIATLLLAPLGTVFAATARNVASRVTSAATNAPASRSVIAALGVVEVSQPFTCRSSASDERFSTASQRVESDTAAVDAARARLVEEHLRLVVGPTALLGYVLGEEHLQEERAELRAARQELTQVEQRIEAVPCNPPPAQSIVARPAHSAMVKVRMELPQEHLSSLRNALADDTDLVVVEADHVTEQRSQPVALGRLASIESTLSPEQPIVIVRARVNDPLSRLRAGELVGVELQLNRCMHPARDLVDPNGTGPCELR